MRSAARPDLVQVAARAGVSRATVSRVVNGVTTVDPDLRRRVESAIDELGYVPHRAARALASRRSDTLALVASEPDDRVFGDPFFGGIVRGVSQELLAAGLQLSLLMAQSREELGRIEKYLASAPIDGVLLISQHEGNDPIPAAMRRAGVPLVIGGRPLADATGILFVDNDNVGGGRLAAERLRSAGRRVVGTVAGPVDMAAGIDRLAGFRAGLGRAYRAGRVEHGDFTVAGGEDATRRLLQRVPDLDGLFVASDLMALGALRALKRAGRRVPDDVAVVGFDDIALAAMADPPLTTVRQQTVLQGRTMVRLYLAAARPDLLGTAPTPDVRGDGVVLPVELVVRDSG